MIQLRKKKEPTFNAIRFTGKNADEVLQLIGESYRIGYLPDFEIRITKLTGNFAVIVREGYYVVVEGFSVRVISIETLLKQYEPIWEHDQDLLDEHLASKSKG
jgi:hypothetical protein